MLTVSIILIIVSLILIIYSVYSLKHTHSINKLVDQQNKDISNINEKLLKEQTNLTKNIEFS